MKTELKRLAMGIASSALLLLYGCGGGSDDVDPAVTPPEVTPPVVAPPVVTPPAAAGYSLSNLTYTDSANFFVRTSTASSVQDTPDVNNNVRYVDRRVRSNAGNVAKWGTGSDPRRNADLHWNGSAWVNCPINFENTSSLVDAQGKSTYNFCDSAATGEATRTTSDIAGKTLASVITEVRAAGYTNLSIGDNSANTLAALLGSATFPAGSTLRYQSSTDLATAISYYPGSGNPVNVSNVVNQYSPELTAGGVAANQAAGVGCNSAESNGNGTSSTTLEGMISAMTGNPCSYPLPGSFVYQNVTYTNPDPVNEAWDNSTVDIGIIGSALVGTGPAPGFYTSNTKLQIAFKGAGTNPVTYYACKQRFNTGSTRNCTVIGTGSYTIATLGDARVLTLNNLPAQADPLTYTTVFVERGGLVYSGFQSKPGVFNSARLNTVAATALLTQLGLTPEDPSVPLALTAASYQGRWDLRDAAIAVDPGYTVFVNADGTVSCQERTTFTNFPCTATITNPATGAVTISSNNGFTASGIFNFLTGEASGTYTGTSATGSFVGHRR